MKPGASPSAAHAVEVIAQHGACGVCLMHMHREPQTMQTAPMEGDAVPQVAQFLRDAALGLEAAGVAAIFPPGTVIAEAAIELLQKLNRQLGYEQAVAAE
jgi:dihydropteroate synthase